MSVVTVKVESIYPDSKNIKYEFFLYFGHVWFLQWAIFKLYFIDFCLLNLVFHTYRPAITIYVIK